MKILFVSDFFANEIAGGAEIYDDILIKELESHGNKVVKFKSKELSEKHLSLYGNMGFVFLVSNFVTMHPRIKKMLQYGSYQYSIVEHDHKYIKSRNPSVYKDFKAPDDHVINYDFYKNAKCVFCQSVKHADVLKQNLKIDNLINLG